MPGIELVLMPASETIVSGEHGAGDLVIRNVSDGNIEFDSGQPLTAVLILPGTDSVIGAFTGHVAGVGVGIKLDSGSEARLSVIIPATGRQSSGLAPGNFAAKVVLPISGDMGHL